MSTTVEHMEGEDSLNPEVHVEHPEHSISHYIVVALALGVLTAIEITLTYVDVGAAFLPLLLIIMMIKFVMVVLEFMHLRRDAALFHYLFWTGFGLAIAVYIGALATFKFFLKA